MSPLFLQKCEGKNGIFLSKLRAERTGELRSTHRASSSWGKLSLMHKWAYCPSKNYFRLATGSAIQRKSSWLKHIQMCYDSVTFHKEDTMVLKSLITPERSCRWEEISHEKAVSSLSTSSHLFHLMEIKIILCESIINLLYCLFQLPRVPEHKNVLKVDAVRNGVFKLGDSLQSSALTQGA